MQADFKNHNQILMQHPEAYPKGKNYEGLMPEAFVQQRIDQRITFAILDPWERRGESSFADFISEECQPHPRLKEDMIALKVLHNTDERDPYRGNIATVLISTSMVLKHNATLSAVFNVRTSPTPRLKTKRDCRLSKFRFVIRGVWKIQDFSVEHPHYVIDCRTQVSVLPVYALRTLKPIDTTATFSKVPIYYNARYKNLAIFSRYSTGEPVFGKIIELSSQFAFCEVLMPWGMVYLVSTDVQRLKDIARKAREIGGLHRRLVITSLRYWNKRIPGTEPFYLRDLRTQTSVPQVLELTSYSDVIITSHIGDSNKVSMETYFDEVLEKIARSETLLQQVRYYLASLPKFQITPDYHYLTLQRTTTVSDQNEKPAGDPLKPNGKKYREMICYVTTSKEPLPTIMSWNSHTSKNEEDSQNGANPANSTPENLLTPLSSLDTPQLPQVVAHEPSETEETHDIEEQAEECLVSLGKRDPQQQTHEWEESLSYQKDKETPASSRLYPLGGMSFFDEDYDDEAIDQAPSEDHTENQTEQAHHEICQHEDVLEIQSEVGQETSLNEHSQTQMQELNKKQDSNLEITPSAQKRTRISIAVQKFPFLQGKSPAQWYKECYKGPAA